MANTGTDVTEDVMRQIALSNGLLDVKMFAGNEIWSGLKLVIPLKIEKQFLTMTTRFENIEVKKLIGKRLKMSFTGDKTADLWKAFMPVRHAIKNHMGTDLYSLQVYAPGFFNPFDPAAEFEKWAAVEVPDYNTIPFGMETLTLPAGLYAVFLYKGEGGRAATKAFQYIFETWLPNSGYVLDDRPHFELLGAKFQNAHPDSEEEIWIPVKQVTE